MSGDFRIVVSCPDVSGLVSAISHFIWKTGGNAIEANQFTDPATDWFYMRYVIKKSSASLSLEQLREAFKPIADKFSMDWRITDSDDKPRVLVMASTVPHCLLSLIYNSTSGDMDFEIPAIVSNHDTNRHYADWHDIPYHHVPVDPKDKEPHFLKVSEIIDEINPDVVVLARYMQIIPNWFCEKYPLKIINIHHSFLPSFIGAKPYHQAYDRGVKLTGATCHYVTKDLDEGPIIQQDVARISHHHSIEDIVRLGKDVERSVLVDGLRSHLEDRVISHGYKTVVFK